MKELDSFTVERLEEIIAEEGYSAMRTPKNDEVRALARIALAAKRAEPVGYWNDACDLDDGAFSYANDAGCTRPLYTTPQLNSQVPLGSWINCSDQMPEDDTLCLGVDECGVIWTMHFDDGEFRADTGDVDDLKISHWMTLPAAPEKGNG
ncbi:DUF551 domain-containing protein [Yersinia enterocolitica]